MLLKKRLERKSFVNFLTKSLNENEIQQKYFNRMLIRMIKYPPQEKAIVYDFPK